MLNIRIVKTNLVPRGYTAITLYPFIFTRTLEPQIIDHEMIHVEQVRRLGWLKFYVLYLYYYAKNLVKMKNHDMAYRAIPFEGEAYERTKKSSSGVV